MTFLLTISLHLEKRESVVIQYYFQEREEKKTGREKKDIHCSKLRGVIRAMKKLWLKF